MLQYLVISILTCLCIILGVAYYTVLERKVLSYAQTRKGPNKAGIAGLAQPLADALKLFIKEGIMPHGSNVSIFVLAPALSLTLALALWHLYPSSFSYKYVAWGVLLFFCVTALNVYGTMLAGWSSNSKYAFLGALRAAAQTISYEVSMLLLLLFPVFLINSCSWEDSSSFGFPVMLLLIPLSFVWFTSAIAETNRAPFDFAEGESEIVSGFNIEFSGALFAMIFLAEYASILFMCMGTSVWFLSINFFSPLVLTLEILLLSIMFLLVRGAYPRYRYDLLMMLCWKSFLPFSLSGLCLVLMYGLML
uniref:NADH-ubiquinone oxidoreductase chain 1 n=1 Tax=Protaeolidiella atra TaxID=1154746 RepID=A0A7S6VGU8_9GAST|nr:NADH dehydrogenase subunit 1 [Protaeolidiella atra]QOW38670.1 NADH dehydrogenase subunit 1 [Protaeolidiella atra]